MKQTSNIETDFVCHCMRMTVADIRALLSQRKEIGFAELYEEHGVGSQCASCEFEVRGLVNDHRAEIGISDEVSDRDPVRRQNRRLDLVRRVARFLKPPRVNLRGGLFALMTEELESKLVVSNLDFPEGNFRPNGGATRFRISVFDSTGRKVASRKEKIPANHSREFSLSEVYPGCAAPFVGAFYVDFYDLDMTGALRPYAILEKRDARVSAGARCHYHDKYATFIDPGFFQTTWPFYSDQECWLAVSNCQPVSYKAKAILKGATRSLSADFELPPFGSKWSRIADLFGSGELGDTSDFDPGLFYLDCAQHVMVCFFWRHLPSESWTGNHH